MTGRGDQDADKQTRRVCDDTDEMAVYKARMSLRRN